MMTLRNILLINAVTSGATGILLVAFAQYFSRLFQVNSAAAFAAVGIFLLCFAAFVISVAVKNANPAMVKAIIALDVSWVVISLLVVTLAYTRISVIGNVLIIAVAGWVAVMAVLQTIGVRQALR